jgi:hypothetical protein
MARQTKLPCKRLVQVIDNLSNRSNYKRNSRWDKYIEGLTFQVVTRLHNPAKYPFPKVRASKPNKSNWRYALIEIRRQELRLIRKTLRSHGL